MLNRELTRQLQRLQDLIKKANDACDSNIELQAHWARYICVLCAGFLENAIKEVYTDFSHKKVSQPLANFVVSKLSPIRNPKAQIFLDIAVAFNTTWRDELEVYLNDDGRGDAIDSIMVNRHLIAHGKHQNSNISLARIEEYLVKAVKVIDFIEQQCAR
jgi:hypothetical protein